VENRIKRRGPPSPTSAAATASLPMEISSPTVVDEVAMRARMDALRCVDLASTCPLPAGADRGHSAPATPTTERNCLSLNGEVSDPSESLQRRRRQRSLDSARVSIYDNVVTSAPVISTPADDSPQTQLDVILAALYRDIGMLSTSLAVVNEERNGNRVE